MQGEVKASRRPHVCTAQRPLSVHPLKDRVLKSVSDTLLALQRLDSDSIGPIRICFLHFFCPFFSVYVRSWLGPVGQTEGGYCAVQPGHVGAAVAKSPFSSYIKKLFITRCSAALLIHAVLSGAKLAHVRRAALWISIFNTILFARLNAG